MSKKNGKEIVNISGQNGELVNVAINPNTESAELLVNLQGHECPHNTTSELLLADEVFLGAEWQDMLDYGVLTISVNSDVDSAVDGLEIQWSYDGINSSDSDVFTIIGGIAKTFTFGPAQRYYRVQYTNGSVNQTHFHLTSIIRKSYVKPSSHRIADNIVSDDDAELVKSVITGQRPDGTFGNASVTSSDNLRVSLDEYGDTPAIDAFDRLRTSNPFTIFDSKQIHDKQPLFWNETLGGSATSVHVPANANTVLTVTANSADFVIRQTKQRFNYQPGKSQLIFMTLHSPQETGTTKRIGAFSGTGTNNLTPDNGIFFETDGTISWNIAKDGTTTETSTQANWNVDPLDGTGPSGLILDLNATQILIIDYEWLGVGRVRVGFVMDGIIRYVHYFNHANDPTFSSVYMSTPNLPLRYDIQSDGSGGGALSHICSSVISEGGIEENGVLRSVDTGTTHIDANAADTTYAIVGIRLKAIYYDISVLPQFFSMINEQAGGFRWSLQLNPVIAGTFTYNDVTNSSVQYATGATANTVTTPGLTVDSGYVAEANKSGGAVDRKFETSLRIGATIAGVADTLVLCCTPLSANADIQGSLTFRELL